MRRIAQTRPLWKLTAAAALLWCVSAAAAEKAAPATSRKDAKADAKTASVKPVTVAQKENLSASYSKELTKIYAEQDLKMAEAVKLAEEKKFREAVRIAEAVRDELKLQASFAKGEVISARLSEAEALVNRLRFMWGRERLRVANEAFANNNLTDAMIYASEAARITPVFAGEAEEMRKRCQGKERSEKFQKLSALSVANPDLKNLRDEARTLLAEAKVFFENKRYPQALDKVEQVYLRDPFNMEAVALAGQIYRVFFTTGYYRHRADYELQSAYTNWQWVEPVFEAPEVPKEITTERKADSHKALSDKLNATILREYKYLKGDAKGAVDLLQRYLKQNRMDINIQHNISPEDVSLLGTVSLDLQNVSVGDVLRYICLMSGLKYRIDPDGVHIGTSVQTMYDRTYEIQPHVLQFVYSSTSDTETSSGNSDDSSPSGIFNKRSSSSKDRENEKGLERDKEMSEEVRSTSLTDFKVTSEMFKKYLMEHGIRFGEDSSISYISGTHTLKVKNTIENLDAISQLIREQNALQAPLILVELKCIEIGENEMEELGFDWSLGDRNLNSNMKNSGEVINANKGGWMLGPGDGTRANEKGERGAVNPIRTGLADGSSSLPLINNLNIFPMLFGSHNPFGSDVPLNISLTINAMSQNTRTEIVSAPKVVALSGINARAKMTKKYYFPNDWETLEIEEGSSSDTYNPMNYTIKRPTPSFDEEEELGIILNVKPTITETGAINLVLDFDVLGQNGRDEYTFDLNTNMTYPGSNTLMNYTFTIWKPIITKRLIHADIDVYDGQTVVLGGSTDNNTQTRTDKIPFLGDLPLIGRLFQSQSEKSMRRNMLLFVTARVLDSDGSMVNSRNQGIPDFNR